MTLNKFISLIASVSTLTLAFNARGAETGRLQFKDIGAISEWRSDGPVTVYVQDKMDQWYKVDMYEACMSENTKDGVQFLTARDFDTNKMVSRVVVDHHICRVTEIAKVKAPPPSAKGPLNTK